MRANFGIIRRTYRTLNDCEMHHNAEVGLFTKPSRLFVIPIGLKPLSVPLAFPMIWGWKIPKV